MRATYDKSGIASSILTKVNMNMKLSSRSTGCPKTVKHEGLWVRLYLLEYGLLSLNLSGDAIREVPVYVILSIFLND
ncbi:hypothetical protein L484_022956 [Morus notabilis]|uniref:Uncharacterized protein n=1 Tax=Morus notabilis TaxID=981085 RepID=W9QTH3_9ROSA|nr:hypothetical protein L484_022956 [Morus notabilis]